MRFRRLAQYEYLITSRKRLAFLRKQQRERERYPLFAEEISASQTPVDVEMRERKAVLDAQHTRDRAQRAMKWRQARSALFEYPAEERRELLAYWRRCGWPGEPCYLLSMLHMHATGRLDMHPRVVRETEACRHAVREVIARIASCQQAAIAPVAG